MTRLLLVVVLLALAGCTAAPSGPPATVRTWTPATPFITTTESR